MMKKPDQFTWKWKASLKETQEATPVYRLSKYKICPDV